MMFQTVPVTFNLLNTIGLNMLLPMQKENSCHLEKNSQHILCLC